MQVIDGSNYDDLVLEKDLVGSGDRSLIKLVYDSELVLIEDAQKYAAKYGYANDGKRLEAMVAAVRTRKDLKGAAAVILLLGAQQPVCRTNCLPAMHVAGITVHRRSE